MPKVGLRVTLKIDDNFHLEIFRPGDSIVVRAYGSHAVDFDLIFITTWLPENLGVKLQSPLTSKHLPV